jgi:hypothetical protein
MPDILAIIAAPAVLPTLPDPQVVIAFDTLADLYAQRYDVDPTGPEPPESHYRFTAQVETAFFAAEAVVIERDLLSQIN